MKKNHFNARIQLTDKVVPMLETFFESIDFFNENNPNIFLEFYLWYDKSTSDSNKIIEICKSKGITVHSRPLLNIPFFADISSTPNEYSCRFNVFYIDGDSFIKSIFEFYNLVKASLNKEIANENRNDRKQAFYRKAKDKRSDMASKTENR